MGIQYTLSFWNYVQYSHMGHEIFNDNLTKICNTHKIGGGLLRYYHPTQAQFEGMQELHIGILSSTN
jgi:hypothetical protein